MTQMGKPNHPGLGFGKPITGVIHTSGPDVRCDENSLLLTGLDMLLCQSVCVYQTKFRRFDSAFGDVYEWATVSAPRDAM